jgi:galactokinase
MGILWTMKKKGFSIEQGLDLLYYGNIPNGSGLSSSASIEVLTGFLLKDLFGLEVSNTELALIGQYAENNYNGVNCGIMDQFAIAMGKKKHAIFLDTADLSYEYAPLELGDAKIVIMNTKKVRGLGDSKYNERRSECEMALAALQKVLPVKSLGELSEEQFEKHKDVIENPIRRKRAKHAVYENQRTIKAVQALKKNDLEYFGKLMIASHQSLQEDYEVTGIELDTIVAAALKQEGVYGARMTGAGFGGCAVSIVKEASIDSFIRNVGKEYEEKIGYPAAFYTVEIGGGPAKL